MGIVVVVGSDFNLTFSQATEVYRVMSLNELDYLLNNKLIDYVIINNLSEIEGVLNVTNKYNVGVCIYSVGIENVDNYSSYGVDVFNNIYDIGTYINSRFGNEVVVGMCCMDKYKYTEELDGDNIEEIFEDSLYGDIYNNDIYNNEENSSSIEEEVEGVNEKLDELKNEDTYDKNLDNQSEKIEDTVDGNKIEVREEGVKDVGEVEEVNLGVGDVDKDVENVEGNSLKVSDVELLKKNMVKLMYILKLVASEYNIIKNSLSNLKRDNVILKDEIDNIRKQYKDIALAYNNIVDRYGIDEEGNSVVFEENKSLKDLVSTLKIQLKQLGDEVYSLKNELNVKNKKILSLEELNKHLKDSLLAVSTSGGLNKEELVCEYKGKAKIIYVTGNGSYGVTTTAYSIANRLSHLGKVAIVDFDLVSPKLDGWYNINPAIVDGNMKGTALSLYVEFNRFKVEYKKSVGNVDYFGGIYNRGLLDKVMKCEYEQLFNTLGSNYDYIVIDTGKVGYSDIQDNIIKMLDGVCHRGVCVTNNDRFDIRDLMIKLNSLKLNKDNKVILLNRSLTTILDEVSKKFMGDVSYTFMNLDVNIINKKKDFNSNNELKARLSKVIDMIT
ncbi:MAG: hypothetical protein QXD03_03990 [Candidatus Anstonellales archaeon]